MSITLQNYCVQNMDGTETSYTFVTLEKQQYLDLSVMKLKELRRLLARTTNEINRREKRRLKTKI